MDESVLSEPLPSDPFGLLVEWIDYAREHSGQENWRTMMLATVGLDGVARARAVLHKALDRATGELVFYTNYNSAKAREIEADPRVSLTMHWDAIQRQIRVEGRAERVAPEVSDAYFATRSRESQIGAWASDQSQVLDHWETMLERIIEFGTRFGDGAVPRPPYWGGYRVIPHRIEFWHGREGRIHERAVYQQDADARDLWRASWLFP